jgi:hypothetical protein
MRKNLRAHESDYTQAKNTQNQKPPMDNLNSQSYRSLKAKSYNKRKSNYDFDRSMDGVSEELRPAAVANRAANASILLIQIN